MVTIRDGIWLLALAVLSCVWYADRAVLGERVRSFQQALNTERSRCDWLLERLEAGTGELSAE